MLRTTTESEARQNAIADGLNPDSLVAGKPAWEHYIRRTHVAEADTRPDPIPSKAAELFDEIAELGRQKKQIEKRMDRLCDQLTPLIKGKKIFYSDAIYVLGEYFNCWSGVVMGKGRRIVKSGKLGTQNWDVRRIGRDNFA